jgi:hypothetical protein
MAGHTSCAAASGKHEVLRSCPQSVPSPGCMAACGASQWRLKCCSAALTEAAGGASDSVAQARLWHLHDVSTKPLLCEVGVVAARTHMRNVTAKSAARENGSD